VSVRELRRRGLGHLAAADINNDGWVDLTDIELYMAGGSPVQAHDAPEPHGRKR
jgi:hypothetical protein